MGHLRPYRGKKSQAIRNGIVLKRGEIFLEVPESGLGTGAGKIKVGDGTTGYENLPYFVGDGAGTVKSVNRISPDESGDVTLSTVPYAENLVSPDNIHQNDTFIFRTAGGDVDLESGESDLDVIKGNCVIDGATGEISVATPTYFKALGFNQFDKTSMVLNGYTINSSGQIAAQSGSYVCYVHAVGGLDTGYTIYSPGGYITRVGWYSEIPTSSTTGIVIAVDGDLVTGLTNDPISSALKASYDGYLCIAVSNTSDLNVHPKWTATEDTDTAEYSESLIAIPTKDINDNNLPTATYGFPAVGEVRDELSFANRTYTQRIGYYPYSASNLETVKALDVDYIYDSNVIFYVLPTPVIYSLATSVSSAYDVNDYGTEEFLGTNVPVNATMVYGQNLRDKLRRDVVTISKQNLSAHQKAQVQENIDATPNHLVFTEASDAPVDTLLNTIVSGNPMNTIMGANKRLLRKYNDMINSKVATVNAVGPDANGNVTLNRVPMADNLYSPDNVESHGSYIVRTTAGSTDIESGEAQLSFIRGTMSVTGRIPESLTGNYSSTYEPDPEEIYNTPNIDHIDAGVWRNSPLGSSSGTYTFVYSGSDWTYNSTAVDITNTYGIYIYGDVKDTDQIIISYVKENRGTINTLKPVTFNATGLNVCSGVLNNTGITSNAIASKSGSYLYYARCPYSDENGYIAYDPNSKITGIGFVSDPATPAVGKTVDSSHITLGSSISTCIVPETSINEASGWVVVECSATTADICIHPRWSGEEDTDTAAYALNTITIPTKDANNNDLPFVSYGLPAVGSIADEINFDLKQYIQRIGHYTYSAANLATVQALGVDYDYDLSHIFYVLTNPIIINLASTVSSTYEANDLGIEYFTYSLGVGSSVNGNTFECYHLYGQNLRDKLRRDVLTISAQSLSDHEKTQVLTNIGAASAASVTQLNNDNRVINKFTRIPDYKMAVLPLIEVLHNTSSSGKQFLGNIIFGRGNSAYHGSIISIRVNDPAGDYYAGFNLMKMGPMLSGTSLDINPCVFKYNNKWYAGLKIVVVNSAINISIQGQFNDTSYSSNNFYGEIINYATHTGGTVSSIDNQEIYDSIDTDRANLEIYDTDIWKLKNESTLYSLIEYHNDSTHNLYGWFRCFKIYTGASLVIKFEFTRGWGNGEGFTYSIVLTNSVNNTLERKLSVLKMPNGPYYQSYDCILKMRLVAAGTANEYYVDFYVDNMNSDRSIASHNYYGITMSYINLSTTGYYGNALSSFMSHTDSYSKNHISEPGGDIFAEYDLVDLLMRADVNRSFTFNCATISHGQSNLFSQNGEFIIDISNKRYVYYRADMGNTPTLFILGYPLMKSGSGGNQPLAFGMVDTNADMQIFYQSDNSLHFTVAKVISGGIPYIQFSLAYSSATVFLLSPRKVPIYHSTTALTPDP